MVTQKSVRMCVVKSVVLNIFLKRPVFLQQAERRYIIYILSGNRATFSELQFNISIPGWQLTFWRGNIRLVPNIFFYLIRSDPDPVFFI